tara:strand:- start:243 stop:800 length:558 start_codon:yes stop_codon:yes gene_type:complete
MLETMFFASEPSLSTEVIQFAGGSCRPMFGFSDEKFHALRDGIEAGSCEIVVWRRETSFQEALDRKRAAASWNGYPVCGLVEFDASTGNSRLELGPTLEGFVELEKWALALLSMPANRCISINASASTDDFIKPSAWADQAKSQGMTDMVRESLYQAVVSGGQFPVFHAEIAIGETAELARSVIQ